MWAFGGGGWGDSPMLLKCHPGYLHTRKTRLPAAGDQALLEMYPESGELSKCSHWNPAWGDTGPARHEDQVGAGRAAGGMGG